MTPQSVTPQMIADQMVCAFEGGSNYWIDKVRLKAGKAHEEPWYACPKLYEDPALQIALWDEENNKHLFGLAEIQEGLQIMARQAQAALRRHGLRERRCDHRRRVPSVLRVEGACLWLIRIYLRSSQRARC